MQTIGRRRATAQGPDSIADTEPTRKISLYEQSREERIRENKERLLKLGILDLSEKLRSSVPRRPPPRREYRADKVGDSPPPPPVPSRRSSRLQNVTPVSYVELPLKKKEGIEDKGIVLEEGAKHEIYTEEHDKLLGSTERSWELFVDGYGIDGKRIYDSVKGKTCHQCRQKTLGYRTKCCKCTMVQGQFCGDCLYMRYGEHVLEALENPNWICPVCRGICNCSLCRQSKGWAPTGALHRKVSRLGYKSVAHFLIQTRREQPKEEEGTPKSVCRSLVKRSLPFSEIEEPESKESQGSDVNTNGDPNQQMEEEPKEIHVHAKRLLPSSDEEADGIVDKGENADGSVELKEEGTPVKPKRKRIANAEPNQDSIGSRLRQRRKMQNV